MEDRGNDSGPIENVSTLSVDSVVVGSVADLPPSTRTPTSAEPARLSENPPPSSESTSGSPPILENNENVVDLPDIISNCDTDDPSSEVSESVSRCDDTSSATGPSICCSRPSNIVPSSAPPPITVPSSSPPSTNISSPNPPSNTSPSSVDDTSACVTPPQTRRVCARNTPTLRSATRELAPEGAVNRRGAEEPGAVAAAAGGGAVGGERTARKELDVESALTSRQSVRVAEKKEIAANLRKRSKEEADSGGHVLPTPEKGKRTREAWSTLEKTLFFEALGEVGKNFDGLRQFIAKKMNRKLSGLADQRSEIRNRDQIRFFYYRSLNKISKFVHLDKDLKRSTRELYILINYGELRKRNINLNERTGQKLNELVHKGSTTVRCRGKAHRVRTPICRALKRINKIPEISSADNESCKLPTRAILELLPSDNATWCRVQTLAHNPRLRLSLPLQFRLRRLIECLQRRWRSPDQRAMDELRSHVDVSLPTDSATTTTTANNNNNDEEESYQLHLKLAPGFCLTPYTVQPAPPAPALNLSLESYYERTRQMTTPPASGSLAAAAAATTVRGANCQDMPVCSTATAVVLNAEDWPRLSFANVLDELASRHEGSGGGVGGGNVSEGHSHDGDPTVQCSVSGLSDSDQARREEQAAAERCRRQVMERSRRLLERGWTEETAQAFTVGELYMMVGRPSRVRLLYRLTPRDPAVSSCPGESASDLAPLSSLLAHLVAAARTVNTKDGYHSALPAAATPANASASCSACTCKVRANATVTCGTQTPPMVAAASPMQDGRGIYYLPPSPPPPSKAVASDWSASSSAAVTSSPGGDSAHGAVSGVATVGGSGSACSATIMPPPSFTGAVRSVSRYRGRGGRAGCRKGQVVVQRMLPVMPGSSHHTGQLSMVNLQLAPSGDQQSAVKFASVHDSGGSATLHQPQASHSFSVKIPTLDDCGLPAKRPLSPQGAAREKRRNVANTDTPASKPSGWLSDSAAPYGESSLSSNNDHVLTDVNFSANSNSSFTGFLASLVKNSSEEHASSTGLQEQTSPTASTRLLNEIGDMSLSSFLGHLDTGGSRPASSTDPIPSKNDLGAGGALSSKNGDGVSNHTSFSFGDKNTL